MCWSEGASLAMVGLGTIAAITTVRRGDPVAIPATLCFFTLMEALQVGGYRVVDECQLTSNQSVTALSYLHISLQPLFINAFGMATSPRTISASMRRTVYALAAVATTLLLARLLPLETAQPCSVGDPLCGSAFCTVSGNWHIAWEMPLIDIWATLGVPFVDRVPFPSYFFAVFVLPLLYGAWRFVVFHAFLGPILAYQLTDNPNEMPAVWCLFSIGIVLVSLSPLIRGKVLGTLQETPA